MEKSDLKKSLLDEEEQKVAKNGVEPTQEDKNGDDTAKTKKQKKDEGKGWSSDTKETRGV
jgi:hypothetical protein